MQAIGMRLMAALLGLALLGMISCDSDSGGGGGAETVSGYRISDFAGTWLLTFTASPTCKMLVTLDQSGHIIKSGYMPANCDSFDQHTGQFVVSGNKLAMREGASRDSSSPNGAYWIIRIQVEIRSQYLLKGSYRWLGFHNPDGSTTSANWSMAITMQRVN